jgi:hypothetical protein
MRRRLTFLKRGIKNKNRTNSGGVNYYKYKRL